MTFDPYTFLQNLVIQLGITDPTLQSQAIADLETVLIDRMMVQLFIKLQPSDQALAYDIADTGNRSQLEDFLATHIPSYLAVVESILDEFAQEYLEGMGKL